MAKRRARKIYSWNVNGLRAVAKNGFLEWLGSCRGTVVGLQEVRAQEADLPAEVRRPRNWRTRFAAAERKGYSGVALYGKRAPDELETSLGDPAIDSEGRLQLARYGSLWIANAYFPNGSGPNRDHSRVPFKLDFYQRLFARLEPLRAAGEAVLVMGDFNTAHEAIDLARPGSNKKTSGFLPEEREELDRWLREGWTDTFRHFHPGEEGHYSWWSQRANCRARNVGWRIDYVLASAGAMEHVTGAAIHKDVLGSDHCPISVSVLPDVLEAPRPA